MAALAKSYKQPRKFRPFPAAAHAMAAAGALRYKTCRWLHKREFAMMKRERCGHMPPAQRMTIAHATVRRGRWTLQLSSHRSRRRMRPTR